VKVFQQDLNTAIAVNSNIMTTCSIPLDGNRKGSAIVDPTLDRSESRQTCCLAALIGYDLQRFVHKPTPEIDHLSVA
jgi:hypothetical protein